MSPECGPGFAESQFAASIIGLDIFLDQNKGGLRERNHIRGSVTSQSSVQVFARTTIFGASLIIHISTLG